MIAHLLIAAAFPDDYYWGLPVVMVVLAASAYFISRRFSSPPEQPTEKRPSSRFVSRRRLGSLLRVSVTWVTAPNVPRPTSGWILDRSKGGLRLTVGATVEPGTRLRVRPCNAPESNLGTLLQVRECRKDGGCWILDCRFVEDAQVPAQITPVG